MILNTKGYPILADLNGAKILKKNDRTYTLNGIGDINYFPPERLQGSNGYSFEYDFWTLGILLYELVCGYLPFNFDSGESPMKIMAKIIEGAFDFPDYMRDPTTISLISQVF